jgi:hypothetical protein
MDECRRVGIQNMQLGDSGKARVDDPTTFTFFGAGLLIGDLCYDFVRKPDSLRCVRVKIALDPEASFGCWVRSVSMIRTSILFRVGVKSCNVSVFCLFLSLLFCVNFSSSLALLCSLVLPLS